MNASAPRDVPDRPVRNFPSAFRALARDVLPSPAPEPGAPAPASSAGTLDDVRAAFWQAYRHLFPPHSLAAQTPYGSVVISWSLQDEPQHPYAAPVLLRFDDALVDVMRHADPRRRQRIAQNHEPTLREGLRGYDPFARSPNARVITLG